MPFVKFETSDIAVARRKLAAAHELFQADVLSFRNPACEIELSFEAKGLIVTRKGAELWCSGRPEPVAKLGRKLVYLADGDTVDIAKQESAIQWTIRIPSVQL